MSSLVFESVRFLNENTKNNTQFTEYNAVLESGEFIRNCNCFISESMIEECGGDRALIEQQAILEGAKFDAILKNFLKEGKDYNGLKKDLNEIIKANDLDAKGLSTGKKGFMHTCKRILQVLYDIDAALFPITGTASTVAAAAAASKANKAAAALGVFGQAMTISVAGVVIRTILSFVISFIINRLLRFAVDTIEFNTLKKDAEAIVDDLERMARNAKDEKEKKKYMDQADKLKESIKKYSKN